MPLNKRSFRILYTSAALLLGICIVFILSLAGDKSHGPLEYVFSKLGSFVQDVENIFIVQKREDTRADKLSWLKQYKSNPALLKNPKIILLGAHDNQANESFESVTALEDSLKTTFPLIQIYQAWGCKPEEQFPKSQVKTILELGSIPVITWEPWLCDFNGDNYPNLRKVEERDHGGMADVADGVYDLYIKQWADDAKEINQPIFLRLGHEMNDPYRYPWGPQNNTPKDYIAAWRHVHRLFEREGATNVIWIWSPHPAYDYFKAFYPGNDYVDYVGVGILNFGTVASWSKWWSFKEMFGTHYKELSAFNKPMMITEFGSLAVGGDRGEWFKEALDSLPINYPAIKSILFFHVSDDKTTTLQSLSWYIKYDTLCTHTITRVFKHWLDAAVKVKK
jgi:hypothetical protein